MSDDPVRDDDIRRQHRKTRDANRGYRLENERLREQLDDAQTKLVRLYALMAGMPPRGVLTKQDIHDALDGRA
jgi:hypothetical protein